MVFELACHDLVIKWKVRGDTRTYRKVMFTVRHADQFQVLVLEA
jgi:hypothetical protein